MRVKKFDRFFAAFLVPCFTSEQKTRAGTAGCEAGAKDSVMLARYSKQTTRKIQQFQTKPSHCLGFGLRAVGTWNFVSTTSSLSVASRIIKLSRPDVFSRPLPPVFF